MLGQLLMDVLKVLVPGGSVLGIHLLPDMPLLVIDQRLDEFDLSGIRYLLLLKQGRQVDIGRMFAVA